MNTCSLKRCVSGIQIAAGGCCPALVASNFLFKFVAIIVVIISSSRVNVVVVRDVGHKISLMGISVTNVCRIAGTFLAFSVDVIIDESGILDVAIVVPRVVDSQK